MTKKAVFFMVSFIVSTVALIAYVIIDLTFFEHRQANYVHNIYDMKISSKDNFVFLGDSITAGYQLNEFYEGIHVVNSGISGNKTDDILSDMENRVYRYNPTKVFLLIGVNDLGSGKTVEEVFDNIKKIIKNIKKNRSNTKIYVESVYPINDRGEEGFMKINVSNNDIIRLNKKLKKYCEDKDITYIDIHKSLKDEKDQLKLSYTVDGLHISSLGYLRITRLLLPYLRSDY